MTFMNCGNATGSGCGTLIGYLKIENQILKKKFTNFELPSIKFLQKSTKTSTTDVKLSWQNVCT
jgi:hypothetical protein